MLMTSKATGKMCIYPVVGMTAFTLTFNIWACIGDIMQSAHNVISLVKHTSLGPDSAMNSMQAIRCLGYIAESGLKAPWLHLSLVLLALYKNLQSFLSPLVQPTPDLASITIQCPGKQMHCSISASPLP